MTLWALCTKCCHFIHHSVDTSDTLACTCMCPINVCVWWCVYFSLYHSAGSNQVCTACANGLVVINGICSVNTGTAITFVSIRVQYILFFVAQLQHVSCKLSLHEC